MSAGFLMPQRGITYQSDPVCPNGAPHTSPEHRSGYAMSRSPRSEGTPYMVGGQMYARSTPLRRSFRTHGFRAICSRGYTPVWYAPPRWGGNWFRRLLIPGLHPRLGCTAPLEHQTSLIKSSCHTLSPTVPVPQRGITYQPDPVCPNGAPHTSPEHRSGYAMSRSPAGTGGLSDSACSALPAKRPTIIPLTSSLPPAPERAVLCGTAAGSDPARDKPRGRCTA